MAQITEQKNIVLNLSKTNDIMNIHKEIWNYEKLPNVGGAWEGLEYYIPSIIRNLNIQPTSFLEFGVDTGYSSWALSKLFKKGTGVDGFLGDPHIGHSQGEDFYQQVLKRFENTNVTIIRSLFEDYIKNDTNRYDLIHIDIVHLYEPTYKCAEWSLDHSNVVILHDTCSFPAINDVCIDLAKAKNISYYNIPEHHGLGILYR